MKAAFPFPMPMPTTGIRDASAAPLPLYLFIWRPDILEVWEDGRDSSSCEGAPVFSPPWSQGLSFLGSSQISLPFLVF